MPFESALELIRSANRLEVSTAEVSYRELSLADIAHVMMLMEEGLVPNGVARKLLSALLEIHDAPTDIDPIHGDLYNYREHLIKGLAPNDFGWLRVARARREATNIAYLLAVRWRLLLLMKAVRDSATALIARSGEHIKTVMPDYTYLHQAQPTTFGHYLMGFVYPMTRDLSRLRACFKRVNLSPGGLGSVNGSRLPINRTRIAELLGFDGISRHTRDAMWQADMPIEIASAAVASLVNIDRLAEDLQIWTTQEFNLVELGPGYSRDSVIMPQKRNPYALTYLRGLASTSIGTLASMANVGRTPSGQPDNRIFAYVEVPTLLDKATGGIELMAGIVSTLKVNAAEMREKLNLGFSQATDLAEVLMQTAKIPYRTAHEIVSRIAVQEISSETIASVSKRILGRPISLSDAFLREILDPHAIVKTRMGIGGAAEIPMREMITRCRAEIAEHNDWCLSTRKRLLKDEKELVGLAKKISGRNT